MAELPHRRASYWRATLWFVIAVVALTIVYLWSYSGCLHGFFHFDDFWVLAAADRIHLRSPLDIVELFRPIHTFVLYRPLSTVTYFYILHLLFGYDPTAFHAVQIACHIVNAVLVYAIADALFLSRPVALGTALVYATAPGHAIAVCWIALFTMAGTTSFYLLGLWVWIRLDSRWRVPLCLILFVVALLASEHAVSLPLVLTLAGVLLEHPDWHRMSKELIGFYAIAAAYVGAKLYYLYAGLDPLMRAYLQSGYGITLDPRLVFGHLGRYVGFTLDVAYGSVTDAWAGVLGVGVVALAALSTGCVVAGRWTGRRVRVATFGIDVFVVALGPVLFLKAHLYSYYVGIAGLGMACAVMGFASIGPRYARYVPSVFVLVFLATHVMVTSTEVRKSEEFRFFYGFERAAAVWLYTLAQLPAQEGIDEVVIPRDGVTEIMFERDHAEKVLLCAPYVVRASDRIADEQLTPGRVILHQPVAWDRLPASFRSWDWLPRRCSR